MHCGELHLNHFKDDFLNIQMFLHPQIFKYCPYINAKMTLMTGFVLQGHICSAP